MQTNKKIFSAVISAPINPGATSNNNATLLDVNRQFQITSITWDFRARLELAPMSNIPIEQNTVLELELGLAQSPLGLQPPALGFLNPLPAVNFLANSYAITFYKPGKRNFSDFLVENAILLYHTIVNRDMLNAIRFYSSVIIEIEEL